MPERDRVTAVLWVGGWLTIEQEDATDGGEGCGLRIEGREERLKDRCDEGFEMFWDRWRSRSVIVVTAVCGCSGGVGGGCGEIVHYKERGVRVEELGGFGMFLGF